MECLIKLASRFPFIKDKSYSFQPSITPLFCIFKILPAKFKFLRENRRPIRAGRSNRGSFYVFYCPIFHVKIFVLFQIFLDSLGIFVFYYYFAWKRRIVCRSIFLFFLF